MSFFEKKEKQLKAEVNYITWCEYILDPFLHNCECHRCIADKKAWV